ncbi:DUF4176 domain-containing protein [Erysipelotrichaceae bacterium OttesenSCG-928-M19]|nr:DUF4176 domain-containing protein [Erysipelotrichaceae bacterium OttesenSCG-928-M19]
MNDIQKNYLVGLILKKVNLLDLEAIKEVNVDNDDYKKNIEMFVEEYAKENAIIADIYNFMQSEEAYYQLETLKVEKIGLYVSVNMQDNYFTIGQTEFIELLQFIECYMREYLPLGSVVKVNKEKLDIVSSKDLIVVIEQRMIHPKGKNYYLDYRAIPYPMGIFTEQMYVYFSVDDIDEIIFEGYSDPENEGYELALKESLIDNDILAITYHKD